MVFKYMYFVVDMVVFMVLLFFSHEDQNCGGSNIIQVTI